MDVMCPYCGGRAKLHMNSSRFYHGHNYGPVWACEPCGAWVGVHENSPTCKPLGRLSDARLRAAKIKAHAAFDPVWKRRVDEKHESRNKARHWAYKWLADEVGLTVNQCHIGMFDVELCERVVEACSRHLREE